MNNPNIEAPAQMDLFAEMIGERREKIRQISAADIIRSMTSGCVVSVHIETPQASAHLKAGDIGIVLPEDVRAIFERYHRLGNKSWLPKEWRQRIEAAEHRIRDALVRHSLDVPFSVPVTTSARGSRSRFVPVGMYQQWKATHEEATAAFFAVRDELSAHWEEIRAQIAADARVMANDIWRRMTSDTASQQLGDDATIEQKVAAAVAKLRDTSRVAFVDYFVDEAVSKVPSKLAIESGFVVTYDLGRILTPSQLAQDEAAAREIIAERMQHDSQARMEEDLRAHEAATRKGILTDFYYGVTRQLNELISEVTGEVLEAIERNGNMRGGASRLRTLVARLEAMNIMDDETIRGQIESLRDALAQEVPSAGHGSLKIDVDNMDRVLRSVRRQSEQVILAIEHSSQDRVVREAGQVSTPLIASQSRVIRETIPVAHPTIHQESERQIRSI